MKRWNRLALLLILVLIGCRAPDSAPAAGAPAAGGGPATGTMEVSFLDVGQGDSALVQLPGKVNLLIDGGPSGAGPAVLKELRRRGVERLDWVIGSHPHEDHIGGLIDVLREVPVDQALDPGYNHGTATQRTYLTLLRDKKVKVQKARMGQTFNLAGGATLQVLAPEDPLLKGTDSDPNNNSVVARLVFGKTKFLFTGDMEEDERARLLRSLPADQLQSDVLKVAHHGSHNGTDTAFLRAVRPQFGVISLAKGNDYGHPHREALQALQGAGVQILRTDERGTITFSTDGKTLKLSAAPAAPVAGNPRPAPAVSAGRVIGNSSSQVYHSPTCNSLPSAGRRVEFASAAEAEKAGYRPHRGCVK